MILDKYLSSKREFNPKSKKDILVYRNFLEHGGWGRGGCPFLLEFPHMTIPNMIQEKIIHSVLGVVHEKNCH